MRLCSHCLFWLQLELVGIEMDAAVTQHVPTMVIRVVDSSTEGVLFSCRGVGCNVTGSPAPVMRSSTSSGLRVTYSWFSSAGASLLAGQLSAAGPTAPHHHCALA